MSYKSTGVALTVLGLGLVSNVSATNGVNMIGIGPNSRAMGGTGIAAPQDAVSAVFSNPAAMCISPSCSSPQMDVSFTTFMPSTKSSVTMQGMGTFKGNSDSDLYFIPAIGVSLPFGEGGRWRGGLAIYGISGLGVDYEKTPLSGMAPFDYTNLAIMKVAPSIAYAITPDVSVGASLHVQYSELEVGTHNPRMGFFGPKHRDDSSVAVGLQLGATWKVTPNVTIGATYTTAQRNTFKNVMPAMDPITGAPNGQMDKGFDLESPQQFGMGIAWVGMDDRMTVALDGKWLNWSNADGYKDFGWEDQFTIGVGVQYEVIEDKLVVRAGYNYGKNPLRNQRIDQDMMSIIGFPAVVEHHLTMGFGYQFNEDFSLNVAWVHAFENSQKSSGSIPGALPPTTVSSSLYEDTIDVGLSWRF